MLGLYLLAAKIVINSQNWELFAKIMSYFSISWVFFLHFSSTKENICIFASAIPGEIGMARESAFFALFLIGESGQFAQEEVKRRGCFRCYVASNHTQHNQRSKSLIHIFLLVGVQTQPIEIRISLGGSALFACDESCLFESWRQNKNKQIYEVFW